MANNKKEKLLIERLLSSVDVFSRCVGIIQPEYFDEPQYRPPVKFIKEYFEKYNSLPQFDVVNAEYDLEFQNRVVPTEEYKATCDEVEKFCQESAFINAMKKGFDLVFEKGQISEALKLMNDAMLVSLAKDLGIDLYDDPEATLKRMIDTEINIPTMIKALDSQLNDGLARKTFTLFSANSGVGKSNMLANLGVNYSLQGLHVLYISLELPEDMIYLRLSSMSTNININLWKQKIPEITSKLLARKNNGAGSYIVKRLPTGTKANDLRSYLKHYELEFKRKPDVLVIDYLDLMHPNGGTKNKGVFEQDKEKSEEVTEILVDYNCIGISASQQNREALRMSSPDQGVIAGGISKVNTVHNYISLSMSDEQSIRGEMFAHFLKTRSSSGKGKTVQLVFDPATLIIKDMKDAKNAIITTFVEKSKAKGGTRDSPFAKKLENIINGLPPKTATGFNPIMEVPEESTDLTRDIMSVDEDGVITFAEPTNQPEDGADLLDLMNSFGNLGK
jgi:hypothetical protein